MVNLRYLGLIYYKTYGFKKNFPCLHVNWVCFSKIYSFMLIDITFDLIIELSKKFLIKLECNIN